MPAFHRRIRLALLLLAATCACRSPAPAPSQPEIELAAAESAYARDPRDEMAAVWLGRRLGYVGRYEEAVWAFTRGLEVHPDSAWLLRFRGHRFITLRRFDDAALDLQRARDLAALRPDEVEPDGAPNKDRIPIGTLRSNIDYHLGLAHFLRGDFAAAWRVYDAGFDLARHNGDRLVSHTYWAWLTLMELGRRDDAARLLEPIQADMPLHENESYRALLMHFKGELSEKDLLADTATKKNDLATRGFGAGMKRLFDGDRAGARELFRRVVQSAPAASFGFIAAETELSRSFGETRAGG